MADPRDLEADFHREWTRSLFGLAVDALRARCRDGQGGRLRPLRALRPRGRGRGPTGRAMPQLAAELGLPVTQVTNHLAWARREFRAAVLETLREITASEAEFRAEARALLGVDAA